MASDKPHYIAYHSMLTSPFRFCCLACAFVATLLDCSSSVPQETPDFSTDILPVFASKCFACHGPDPEAREADLRLDLKEGLFGETEEGIPIVRPDDLDNSEMWWRIAEADAEDRMPPETFAKVLTQEEKNLLQRWIEAGAPWEGHWAFEPLTKPELPEVSQPDWIRTPIDAFVMAKLDSLGMTSSPEADRRTLIRRLTFDLHGLPPTPEEIAAFLNDDTPDAYERLVDRLLASPRYGERWARHWLDVAHYADTHGYDKDKRRDHAWPYRDYVIGALNDDEPYGRFVEEQLAGDVLYPDDPQAVVATGFIAAGPWDFVGHVELREGTVDKKITRLLDRDDMVSSAMNVFTSLTVQCARCHDHKFDPITQQDYYALQAVFGGIDRADRIFDADPAVHRERQRLLRERTDIKRELDPWLARLEEVSKPELDALDKQLGRLRAERDALAAAESPGNGYHSLIAHSDAETKWVQVDLGSTMPIDAVQLIMARPTDFPDTPGFGFPIRFKIEASTDESFTSSTALLDQSAQDFPGRTDSAFRLDVPNVEARYLRVTATRLWKRLDDYVFALAELEAYSSGKNVALGASVSAADSIDSGRWHTRYLTDGFDSRQRLGSGTSDEDARERTEIEREIASLGDERSAAVRRTLTPGEREELDALENRLAEIESGLAELPDPQKVYAAASDFDPIGAFTPPGGVRDIHVLRRGDVNQEGELASPGTVGCIANLPARFQLTSDHIEGDRREALAKWIADESNPLTWRSVVNRVWQYHFGVGLVDTPNDFGRMGSPPTHPELLDWLATEFLAQGQSLKRLHRLIVTSATYRQSSAHNPRNAELDSSNRLLWRMNRRQLDAEALRDSILYLGGKLDLTMGGPGFDAFAFEDDHSPRYLYDQLDPSDTRAYRRSIYRFVVRSVPDPLMTSLDCADPSQSVPVRTQTLTAIQALSLMNNPAIVRQAAFLADRIVAAHEAPADQIDALYRLALGRELDATERDALIPYLRAHGLPAACRLVLNTNEFMFVD